MPFPDIIVAGTAKAGTTSLFQLLKQHPAIFPSRIKEPRYFAYAGERSDLWSVNADPSDEVVQDYEEYQKLYSGANDDHLTIEASPNYLYSPTAAQEIKKRSPNCRLIFILRNPIDRAFSHYSHMKRDEREPLPSFEKALKAETERIKKNYDFSYHYAAMGRYAEQLERFYSVFPRSQIKTFDYDRFSKEPELVLSEIFEFLSIESQNIDCGKRHNVSHQPPNTLLLKGIMSDSPIKKVVSKILPDSMRAHIKTAATAKPKPTKCEVEFLKNALESDTRKLAELVEWDVGSWEIF